VWSKVVDIEGEAGRSEAVLRGKKLFVLLVFQLKISWLSMIE
jgi:hypothetical protein